MEPNRVCGGVIRVVHDDGSEATLQIIGVDFGYDEFAPITMSAFHQLKGRLTYSEVVGASLRQQMKDFSDAIMKTPVPERGSGDQERAHQRAVAVLGPRRGRWK